jgi:type II secretion system protein N
MSDTIAVTLPSGSGSAASRPAWQKLLGYGLFTLAALFFWLYVTFPYDAVRGRLVNEARAAGLSVQMESIGPGLFGVTASKVRLAKLSDGAGDPPPAIELDSLALRPALFPPGIALRSKAFGGTITGSVGPLGDLSVRLRLNDLDPSKGNLQAVTGLDLEGRVNGEANLEIPRAEAPKAGPGAGAGGGFAFSQADGDVALDLSQVVIKGGSITVPYYGQPTPFDIPRVALGDVQARLVFENGAGKLERFKGQSEDLELLGDGTLKLANNLRFSETDLNLKIKADPEFRKRLGFIGAGLSVLPADRANADFRVAKISGFIGRPNFGPGRQ